MMAVLDGRVPPSCSPAGFPIPRASPAPLSNGGHMAKVLTYPGEDELAALAEGTLRVLRGAERALNYRIVPKSGVWHDQPDQESRT